MRKIFYVNCLGYVLAVSAAPAGAQEASKSRYGYDDPVEEKPIVSEVYTPKMTYNGKSGGVITFYGQLNLVYQSFNDGAKTTSGIVDNGNWNTRLGVTASQPLDADTTFRARFETGLGLRNSALVSQEFKPDWIDWQRTSLRWFEVALDTRYGTVSAGQGSSASNGTAGLDESFTFHAGAADSSDGFASMRFRDRSGELTNVSIGQVNNSFDGARRFRIRYDTPVFNGFMISSSYGQNILTEGDDTHYYDVAVRWNGDVGDFEIQSALGYQWLDDPNGENTRRLAGSATLVHTPTGLNLAVSAGQQIDGANYIYTRAGWRADLIEAGKTSLSADYYYGRDFLSDGARTINYGLYAVQTIDRASIDLYAGWRRFTYSDNLGNTYQDADGVLAGARFFF